MPLITDVWRREWGGDSLPKFRKGWVTDLQQGNSRSGEANVPSHQGSAPCAAWGCGPRGRHSLSPSPASSQVFALIVFSCIFGEGYSNTHDSQQQYCVFNRNEDACRYGSAIGVLAFLASAFFFVVDIYFPQISNATDRKYLVIGDLLFSGIGQLAAPPLDLGVNGSSSVPRSSRGL